VIRRAAHRALYLASLVALAAVYVPSAALLPAAGDWLDGLMWHHDERMGR
jgi:hypothetical protein